MSRSICDCVYRYSAEEIHFNLMAIVSDRLQQYQKSIDEIHKQIEVSQKFTGAFEGGWSAGSERSVGEGMGC